MSSAHIVADSFCEGEKRASVSRRSRFASVFTLPLAGVKLDARMRLWTVHPKYLDTKGLLAAWREGLLAQKVLKSQTKGYRNHPQLTRFKNSDDPLAAIAEYLRGVRLEAEGRGYNFNAEKIGAEALNGKLRCTRGQLLHEWEHLRAKLKTRDADRHERSLAIEEPEPHPLFEIVEGDVEDWEITSDRLEQRRKAKSARVEIAAADEGRAL